ncbi:MAG: RNA pseudouridine synthase [Saprospiraceae bacterium]|nr:RNA pseudouridine synthase [Saprospiraceae bacterium]MCB9325935.1 RNA pseudouridine synthase [Lewinellaceae bacterium]
MKELEILFENGDFIIINKPAGLITEVNPFEPVNVESLVLDYISKSKRKAFVGVVHRLDRVTSGVMVFAKKKSILKQINASFEHKQVQKNYWTIVGQKPPEASGTLKHFLIKDQQNKRAEIFPTKRKDSKPCSLRYKIIDQKDGFYLLEVSPEGGKYHQIRAQLSFIGCPIIGDEKYGSKKKYKPLSICLHARTLSFPDPLNPQNKLSYTADHPIDTPWNLFKV